MENNEKAADRIAMLEQRDGRKISWYTVCPFYASGLQGRETVLENALFYLTDTTFRCWSDGFEDSFAATDVLYTDVVLMQDVRDYLAGRKDKVKRANPLKSFTSKTLISLELEGRRMIFLDVKVSEFKQLLSIAQAKLKYSRNAQPDL